MKCFIHAATFVGFDKSIGFPWYPKIIEICSNNYSKGEEEEKKNKEMSTLNN